MPSSSNSTKEQRRRLPEWIQEPVTLGVLELTEAWRLVAVIEQRLRPPRELMPALTRLYLWLQQADEGETLH